MPGGITHLNAAFIYASEALSTTDIPMFYLGSVAPDAVNVNGFAPKSIRWAAHLRDENISVWKSNLQRFYHQNIKICDPDYLGGYVFHILADIIWDEKYNPYIYRIFQTAGVPENLFREKRWDEIFAYEHSQAESPWYKQALSSLRLAVPADIATVSANEIFLLQESIVNNKTIFENTETILTPEIMLSYFNDVINEFTDRF